MKAIVLAGGKGTRLRPYTVTIPKPLLPLADTSVLEVTLRRLGHFGFRDIVITLAYKANLIQASFGDGRDLGLNISYLVERQPLGTAGCLGALREWIDEPVLVINGDLLTDLDFGEIFTDHTARGSAITIGAVSRSVHIDFGVVEFDGEGALEAYREKPVEAYWVSMGINVVGPSAVSLIGEEEHLDMPDLHLRALDRGLPVRCHRSDCLWLDIGRPDDFNRATELYEADPARFAGGEG